MGGTFDPIHNAHLAVAQSVIETFQVDELHFVPAFAPPHKQLSGLSSPFHRFAMVVLATTPFADFRASTIELDSLEKRYTVETLELMLQAYPAADLLFIAGTDMYQEIETWRSYERIFELAHLVIVNRPGFPFRPDVAPYQVLSRAQSATLPEKRTVFYLPFLDLPISSSEIRDDRKRGGEVRRWLPPQVWSYIEKNNLYQ
jgi:nicotinate-nucleotide adenylyltransferase